MNIRKEYESGRTLQDIANELGVAKSTVAHFLKLQGVERRPRGPRRKLAVREDAGRS
jgi:predicted transcriptional regulator